MNVEHILSEKGRNVVTIDPQCTLAEAARTLSDKRIGAVIVSSGNQPVLGILSERDIVRAINEKGSAALNEPVSRYMTAKVVTCLACVAGPGEDVHEAAIAADRVR